MTLHPNHFDLLEHLHILDADRFPVLARTLEAQLGIEDEAVFARMRRLIKAGYVVSRRDDRRGPVSYLVTPEGCRAYRLELARMDGVTAPPAMNFDVELASTLATATRTLITGTEAAA